MLGAEPRFLASVFYFNRSGVLRKLAGLTLVFSVWCSRRSGDLRAASVGILGQHQWEEDQSEAGSGREGSSSSGSQMGAQAAPARHRRGCNSTILIGLSSALFMLTLY